MPATPLCRYVSFVLHLHELSCAGKQDVRAEVADDVHSAMSALWDELNPEERQTIFELRHLLSLHEPEQADVWYQVNDVQCVTFAQEVTYEQLVELAKLEGTPNVRVTYHGRMAGQGCCVNGTLFPGGKVELRPSLAFRVEPTT